MSSRGLAVYELDGKEYLLIPSEAKEVDEYSDKEPDDNKFNAWFRSFVSAKHISPRADKNRAKYWSRVDYSGDNTVRLAMIQRAATTLIGVVSPNIKSGDVSFAEQGTSTVDIAGAAHRIRLPVSVIKGNDIYEDIDAVAGYGIHEAYHLNDSVPLLKDDISILKELDKGDSWQATLYKLVEDFRVNALGNKDNPGFAHYIDEVYEQIYKSLSANYQLPDKWPTKQPETPDAAGNIFGQQLAALTAPLQYGKFVGDGKNKPYYDRIQKAQQFIEEYTNKGRSATTSDLRATVKKLSTLMDLPPSNDSRVQTPIPTSIESALGSDDGLTTAEAERITAAVDAGMVEEQNKDNEFLKGAGIGDSTTTIVKPLNKWQGFVTIGKMPNEVLKADAQLRITKTRERNEDHYMRSGNLDEDELHRLYLGDDRVFVDVTEEVEEEAAIYFCIDVSGSMSGLGIKQASDMAWLLVHSMHKRQNVKVKVFAFTSGGYVIGVGNNESYGAWSYLSTGKAGTILYRVFEEGDSLDRLDWLPNLVSGGTPEADAAAWCGKYLLEESEPKKYLIMLTDGTPGDRQGDGPGAVRKVVNQLTKKGLFVAHIGLSGAQSRTQAVMYDHYVKFTTIDRTIREFAKILDKVR